MATKDGYDPRRSKVSEDRMAAWRDSQVTGDIQQVPGIGPAAAAMLADGGHGQENVVGNAWQLFGKYLQLKSNEDGEPIDIIDHNNKFWYWLKYKGIKSHRSAIVKAVAEKTTTFFPNFYDVNVYEDEEQEED